MLRKKEGITLIALVITIIVLLILAGITLALVSGENGILKRATNSVEVNEKASAEEEANLLIADVVTQYYEDKYVNNNANLEKIDDYIKNVLKNEQTTEGGYTVKYEEDKGQIVVSKNEKPISAGEITNGKVQWSDKLGGISKPEEDKSDYTENLLYKVDFNHLLNDTNDEVTIAGSGIQVDPTNTYATLDGASGIIINDKQVDPEKKLIGQTSKTIALWYRTENLSEAMQVLIATGNTIQLGGGVAIDIFSDKSLNFGVGHNLCDIYITPETRFDNNWHFLAGIFENGNMVRGYFDEQKFENSGSYNTLNSQVTIGFWEGGYFYKGDLADIRIYASALTDKDVKQLYQYGKELLKVK